MRNSRTVLIIASCMFCLSLSAGFLASRYVENSVGDGIFALSFEDGAAAFGKKDVNFLTKENCYFTFAAVREAEAFTKTARTHVEITGTNADYASITGMRAISGSFFNDIHEKKLSNTAVLNSAAAWRFFGNKDCAGCDISINGKNYYVAGVFENTSPNETNLRIFLPFDVFDKEFPDCGITGILIKPESESAAVALIKDMGYAAEDLLILDLEQYKTIIMQRVRIVVFLTGLYIIIRIIRTGLANIKAIAEETKLFFERNYAADALRLALEKRFLFESGLLAGKLLTIFIIVSVIKFTPCLPYYFFSMDGLNYKTAVDLINFFIQPYILFEDLEYLNGLNLVSGVMLFTSILSGTVILAAHVNKRNYPDIGRKRFNGKYDCQQKQI